MPLKQLLIVLFCLAGIIKCLVQQLYNVEFIEHQTGMTEMLKVAGNECAG